MSKSRAKLQKGLASEKSIQSAQKALSLIHLPPEKIDCLVHVSVTRDCLEPATACMVHSGLGLKPHAMNFDISNACLGFLNGFFTVADMIELGHIERGLIVGTEMSSPLIQATIEKILKKVNIGLDEAQEYLPSLTLGSGSAAIILAHDSVSTTEHKFLGGVAQSAEKFMLCCAD